MKRLIVLLMFTLLGCGIKENASLPTRTKDYVYIAGFNYAISIVEIDSCEYITFDSDVRTLTHKGNCKNSIHDIQNR